jgi:hypothetical protein
MWHTSRLIFCKMIKHTLYDHLSPVVEFSHGAFFLLELLKVKFRRFFKLQKGCKNIKQSKFEWFVIIECERTDKYTNLFTLKRSRRNSLNYIHIDRYCNRKKLSHSSEKCSIIIRHTSRLIFCKRIKYTLYDHLSPVVEFSHGAFFLLELLKVKFRRFFKWNRFLNRNCIQALSLSGNPNFSLILPNPGNRSQCLFRAQNGVVHG